MNHFLRSSILSALLCCAFAQAQSAGPAPAASAAKATGAAAPHPLVGTWSWTLPGKTCTETWQYRADGRRLGTSGEEVTQGDYQVPAKPTTTGFYPLTETVTSSNGKRDCSGDLHADGDESVLRFIQFSPKQDQFIVCKAASLEACFGPLKRVPG
ncbi:hypothetical protein PMI15_03428 [Polaromonas sp. CF318]|uniref:hypothetical protein n=1 Tax=Polaromonas sp. CF318 TaxID=1144318 RepID=UPI00027135B6|nr:hypothetical protein [Polaromonas sp. CF318]EJL81386.1 hypothetical protein PMI15_03428 [Polaromonas sp. CF318]